MEITVMDSDDLAPAAAQRPMMPAGMSAAGAAEAMRAAWEAKGAIEVAKSFPRDRRGALDRILSECRRPALAEHAIYAYPRGGEQVAGPSIRLAEAIAQNWGNLTFGVRELSQANGESTLEAYAWDIENNTRSTKTFVVRHKRDTKRGSYDLTDSRDIYELVANQGARRLRACILAVVPGDVVDAAVAECERAQAAGLGATPAETLKSLVAAFAKFGITAKQIERRLGHNLEATTPAEILNLRRIHKSLTDGMAAKDDFFEAEAAPAPASGKDAILAAAKK